MFLLLHSSSVLLSVLLNKSFWNISRNLSHLLSRKRKMVSEGRRTIVLQGKTRIKRYAPLKLHFIVLRICLSRLGMCKSTVVWTLACDCFSLFGSCPVNFISTHSREHSLWYCILVYVCVLAQWTRGNLCWGHDPLNSIIVYGIPVIGNKRFCSRLQREFFFQLVIRSQLTENM